MIRVSLYSTIFIPLAKSVYPWIHSINFTRSHLFVQLYLYTCRDIWLWTHASSFNCRPMPRMAHYLDRAIPVERVNYMAKRFSTALIRLQRLHATCPRGYDNQNGGSYRDLSIYGQLCVNFFQTWAHVDTLAQFFSSSYFFLSFSCSLCKTLWKGKKGRNEKLWSKNLYTA